MSNEIGIGELAARSGRSIHALRYYESIGLMPFVARDAGGRRRYDPQHVEWLMFLDRLQQTGMALSQMQQYAVLVSSGKQTIARRIELLDDHLKQLDRQMVELARSRKLLVAKIHFYEDWKATGKRPKSWWNDAAPTSGKPVRGSRKKSG